jgi:hypothetical protein
LHSGHDPDDVHLDRELERMLSMLLNLKDLTLLLLRTAPDFR